MGFLKTNIASIATIISPIWGLCPSTTESAGSRYAFRMILELSCANGLKTDWSFAGLGCRVKGLGLRFRAQGFSSLGFRIPVFMFRQYDCNHFFPR